MIVFDNIISDAKIVKKYENDDFLLKKILPAFWLLQILKKLVSGKNIVIELSAPLVR